MTPFASIWTNKDTAERGPTVDEQAAEVSTDFAELTTVLHVATDGPHGLWTVAVTLDPENAVNLIEKIAERYGLTVAPQVVGVPEYARRTEYGDVPETPGYIGIDTNGHPLYDDASTDHPQTWGEAMGIDEGPAFYQTPEDPS